MVALMNISFHCIYGFDRLQLRKTWFFSLIFVIGMGGDAVVTCAGPLKKTKAHKNPYLDVYQSIIIKSMQYNFNTFNTF